jgi:hypothetical protein
MEYTIDGSYADVRHRIRPGTRPCSDASALSTRPRSPARSHDLQGVESCQTTAGGDRDMIVGSVVSDTWPAVRARVGHATSPWTSTTRSCRLARSWVRRTVDARRRAGPRAHSVGGGVTSLWRTVRRRAMRQAHAVLNPKRGLVIGRPAGDNRPRAARFRDLVLRGIQVMASLVGNPQRTGGLFRSTPAGRTRSSPRYVALEG